MEKETNRYGTTGITDGTLNPGERLLIWRRRKKWKQEEAAKHCHLSLFNYRMAEYGNVEIKVPSNAPSFLEELDAAEKCLIFRKRSGRTQKQIAEEMNVCRNWMRIQEANKIPARSLVEYWEAQTKH